MILIEREALLSLLSHSPLHDECYDDEEYYVVSSAPEKQDDSCLVHYLRDSTSFDDCSLTSSSCSELSESPTRGVSFSGEDEVNIVERLYPQDCLNDYFYSCEDTQRFRQEYRLERKVLAELDLDASLLQDDLTDLFSQASASKRHHISRVVVLHNDKIETFCSPESSRPNVDDFFDNDSFWSGSITWY